MDQKQDNRSRNDARHRAGEEPRDGPPPRPGRIAAPPALPDLGPEERINLLLVDDRDDKLLALEALLSDLPLNIVRATSGRDALRALLQDEYALILLDVNMPGMDGFETAQLIRQRQSLKHLPIIFVTAYHDEVFMARGYSLGAVDYILQPVVPEILRSKVSVFVDLHRKARLIRKQVAEQEARADQLQRLAAASVAINAAPTMPRMLQTITDTARDIIGTHQAITVFVLDEAAGSARHTEAFTSFSERYANWRGRPLNLDACASTLVGKSHMATRMTDEQLRLHPDWEIVRKADIPPIRGVLVAPLIARDQRQLGLVYLSDKAAGAFGPDDEAILVQLAQMGAVAIENFLTAEAREANRAKDQFIAVLSHELRTPLTPVLGTIAALMTDTRLPTDVQDDLALIRRNVELEARLIDDLLDFTRISKGKIELHLANVDAHELLREALAICQAEISAKAIDVALELSARQYFVRADATRLQQVFWNLIKNAAKFTPPRGRITIRTRSPHPPATPADAAARGSMEVAVSDTGIGIEPEVIPRLFNAFEQGRASITRQFGGLGLGLTISKALVDRHGGTLHAHSEGQGKGATFSVTIPLSDQVPEPAAYPAPRLVSAPPSRQLRILLVEDHADTARVMSRFLRGASYHVDWAASCTQALQCTQHAHYDILISDIGLPDGSGIDLIRQITARQPITGVALSGFGMEHDIARSRDAGFLEHLTKPLNVQTLLETIERLSVGLDANSPGGRSAVAGG